MTVKIIIFDFDGTLADTLDTIVKITNRLSTEFGYQKATEEDIENLRNLSSKQIIKTSGIPIVKIPFLLHMIKGELNNEIKSTKPISGIEEVLINLKNLGYKLAIITSNSQENVMGFLQKNSWVNLFDRIYCETNIFGKNRVINKLIKKEKVNEKNVIYVGDETRDIDACKKIKVKVIAVSWGFNSKQILANHNPDFLIDQPKELLDIIARWETNNC